MEQTVADRDQRVMSIVINALHLPPAERRDFLRMACGSDEQLFAEITEEVAWEERMGDFLRQPLFDFQDFDPPFKPGDEVLDRFVIMREAGTGGMSIVYEVFDRKRNHRVAIKCAKYGFRRLLTPELEGALKVRHPNICLVNEIHSARVEGEELDFLTMEYLDGETLAARLNRSPLTRDEAYSIATQLCKGVAEAHRVGVIHRDLKTGNVILVMQEDGETRAVITDFGLAASPANCDGMAGTPPYMAPELWRGEKASKASDLYALGVMLYEMVAGQRPFDEIPLDKRFERRPVPPSTFVSHVPSHWDEIILRCLDPDPAKRPADAQQVLDALKPPVRHWVAAAVFFVLLLIIVGALITPVRERVIAIFRPPDVRLAILPPDATPDTLTQANGILQDIGERLQRQQRGRRSTFVVIPATDAIRSNVHTPEDAKKTLHATHAVQLKLRRDGDKLAFDEDVVELETLTHLRDFSASYTPTTLGDAPTALTGTVSTALRLREDTRAEKVSPAATAAYEQGLYFLRKDYYSYDQAIAQFREAATLDPHSALPLAGLAEAEVRRFDMTKAPDSLQTARDALSRAEALNPDSVSVRLASGLLNYSTGEYAKALEDYQRVQDLEPRNIDVILRIASVYDAENLPQRAIENYRKAINLDPNYYRSYSYFGAFWYRRGNYPEAAAQFKNAVDHAPGVYEAYTNLGGVLVDMGRDAEAEQALRKSLDLHETPSALNAIGATLAYEGRDAEAITYYQRAVVAEPGTYQIWMNLGDSCRRANEFARARAAYERGRMLVTAELEQNPRSAIVRAFAAYFEARLDDTARARDDIVQSLHMSPDDNQVIRTAVLIYELLGQRDQTVRILERARPGMLGELNRHPDLADLRQDPRFKQLLIKSQTGGS
jgi:serine/threonine protein kinase/tetratricopeptide (TPR) repeat protein